MNYTISITSQGQMSLPAKIRREFGFDRNRKARLHVSNGKLTLEPIKDLLSLRGVVKSKVKVTSTKIRKAFEQSLSERAAFQKSK